MDHPLTPDEQNLVIEEALHTYPLAALPRDLAADVMSRIQSAPAPRPFRLTWSDFVLSLAISLCIGAVGFSLYNLPPLAVALLRKESILFYQYLLINARWLIPVLFFGAAAFLAALTIPYLRQELAKKSA